MVSTPGYQLTRSANRLPEGSTFEGFSIIHRHHFIWQSAAQRVPRRSALQFSPCISLVLLACAWMHLSITSKSP